jgi:hypothetical protein
LALDTIGNSIQLLPILLDRKGVLAALRRALAATSTPIQLEAYDATAVASTYLEVDSRRFSQDRQYVSDRAHATYN